MEKSGNTVDLSFVIIQLNTNPTKSAKKDHLSHTSGKEKRYNKRSTRKKEADKLGKYKHATRGNILK